MANIGIKKNLASVSLLSALLYAPPALLEMFLKTDSSKIIFHTYLRPIIKVLIGLGIARTLNRVLNHLATNNWRISSSTPGKPWDWPNEIAVVTGGCGDFGVALVQGLTEKGVRVAVVDIAPPPLALQSIASAVYFKCDVTSLQEVTDTAGAIRRTFGGDPSVLVNNAGIARLDPLLEVSEASLRQVLGVNLLALWFTAQQFLPAMVRRDKGHVVTVASLASFVPLVTSVDYSVTKAGALAFHEGLACEIKHVYAAPGVKASIVHPNFVRTAMTAPFADRVERTEKLLAVEDVIRPVLAHIFSGRGGQLVIPESLGYLSGLRGWPNWMQEMFRDKQARDMVG